MERMYQKATTYVDRDSNELTAYLKSPKIQPSEKLVDVEYVYDFPINMGFSIGGSVALETKANIG